MTSTMSTEPDRIPPEVEGVAPRSPTSDERTLAVLCHLGGFFTSFVLPLILWLVKREESPFINKHGREALNFQISLIIYYVVPLILTVVLVGFVLVLALLVFEIVVIVQACIAASRGESYRYPLCIRLIKE